MQLNADQLKELEAACEAADKLDAFADQLAIMEPWLDVVDQRSLPRSLQTKFGLVYFRMISSSVTGTLPDPSTVKVKSKPLTPDELAWTEQQPVIGKPSLIRLRIALDGAGLPPIELMLDADGEVLSFALKRAGSKHSPDKALVLRQLITIFRASGFEIGFSEIGIYCFNDQFLSGSTLVGPVDVICEIGPVPVERPPSHLLNDEVVVDLSAVFDYAMQAQNSKELIERWPKLPVVDMDELPPNLRERYDQFIRLVALKTFEG